jgi:5-dehydro-2-deoxygluconokinase
MGRVGVDIYPLEVGAALEDVTTFGRFLGGSATNVAVAAARHGRRSAVITRVGKDPFGIFVRRSLRAFGVDDRYLSEVEHLPTPITFCAIRPPDDFPVYFYRHPKAPDLEIRPEELDLDAIRRAPVFWLTATGLCQEPSLQAHEVALQSRAGARHTVLDLDFRPTFWPTREAAREQIRRVLPNVTVAVGNQEECEVAVGERDPDAAAEALLARGIHLAVVKRGHEGVLARTPSERVVVAPHKVEVLNGLGAGDAFGGAVCHGLLSGWPLERTIQFANVAGAIVASRLECANAMPTSAEVDVELAR